jgi:hypothetical protein
MLRAENFSYSLGALQGGLGPDAHQAEFPYGYDEIDSRKKK